MTEVDLSFVQRLACLIDLERRYLQSDRTVADMLRRLAAALEVVE